MELEKTEILERTIPLLAKLFGFLKEEAWKILKINNLLVKSSLYFYDSTFRCQVNEWWEQYRSILSAGLGICSKVSSPSKLPRPTYEQIICLTLLTNHFVAQKHIRERTRIEEEERRRRPTPWQRFLRRIKSVFKK